MELWGHRRRLQLRWWPLSDLPLELLEGPPSTSSISVVAAAGPADSTPRGPSSTSSTSVVATAGPAASNPQGAHHRRLQHRWWPLPEISIAAPRGPTIDIFNFSGGRCRTCRQHPQGARHRRLQFRWWSLPGLPTAPPRGGPPLTSTTPVVAAAKNPDSNSQGHAVDVSLNLVPAARIFLPTPTRGATAVNITTTSKATWRKVEARVSVNFFWVLVVPRTRES
jgi:hypothetical protein